MAKIKTVIKKAKRFYFEKWRGKEKVCPAFGEKVCVTRLGWNHIVYNRRHKTKDVVMRLNNLKLAKELLETATLYQDFRKTGNLYYYGFDAVIRGKKIRVIVSSKGKKGMKNGSVSPPWPLRGWVSQGQALHKTTVIF